MKATSTISNGHNDPVDWKVTLLALLSVGCGAVVYVNYPAAAAGFTDGQMTLLLIYGAISIIGLALLRSWYLLWQSRQPVEDTLILKNGLVAFKDEESGLWGLLSKEHGVIAEPKFEALTLPEWGKHQDFITVVVEGRTDAFSISQQRCLIPAPFDWVRSICGGDYHVVADPTISGSRANRGVFCTKTNEFVAPTKFVNPSAVSPDGHYMAFSELREMHVPGSQDKKHEIFGLYSIKDQRIIVPLDLRYHGIEFGEDGSINLRRVSRVSKQGKYRRKIWQNDVYGAAENRIHLDPNFTVSSYDVIEHDHGVAPRYDETTGQVFLRRFGLDMVYPRGTASREAKPA